MTDLIFAEVVRHHEDLARWLGSEAEPGLLDTFRAMHRPEFSLVAIDGVRIDLPALAGALAGARNAVPGLKIGIEEFELLVRTDQVVVCRFLERHSVGSLRRVTAVLVPDPTARYGVRWLSVHETPVL
ncbi:conserved hypothetical protein [Kribbella flavida DSM 17836]|uniref:DUF4440 domain-containing protein n=1 Tax=Kribbella flavida (strain DSM 17836 / JCM 10339 / NBRC 14399) TaxID=479435 RepID=D2Q390_KRIFD|nr:hypothetical protein [Kribbella flavida]ADB32215.1 conserved hypothetical protein [Kribbella flavida DSM 17836]